MKKLSSLVAIGAASAAVLSVGCTVTFGPEPERPSSLVKVPEVKPMEEQLDFEVTGVVPCQIATVNEEVNRCLSSCDDQFNFCKQGFGREYIFTNEMALPNVNDVITDCRERYWRCKFEDEC